MEAVVEVDELDLDVRAGEQDGSHGPEVGQVVSRQGGEGHERALQPLVLVVGQVVEQHELAVVVDVLEQLVHLQADEVGLGAQLDDRGLDLLGHAADRLAALQHGGDVAHGDQVLDLQRGERGGGVVQADLVALQRLEGLVAADQQPRDLLERVLRVADVDGDDGHVLADGDDRHRERAGDPLGRAVPGPRLAGEHAGVGHQVDVGSGDAAGVRGEDDGRVHLAQLGQPLGRELGVHQEAARADGQHIGIVADDEERAPLGLDHPVQPVPQRRARGDGASRARHLDATAARHLRSLGSPVGGNRRRPGGVASPGR